MSRVVDSLDGVLGRRDGEAITVHVEDGREEDFAWDPAYREGDGAWLGESIAPLMRMMSNLGVNFPGNPSDWRYPASHPELPTPDVPARAFGFNIHTIEGPGPFLAAGLSLQEMLVGFIQPTETVTEGNEPKVALNYYSLAEGAQFLTPVPDNFGVQLETTVTDTRIWVPYSTGWQNSPADPPSPGANWYPELYGTGNAFNLRNFYAARRWVAGDVGAAGGSGAPSKFPPISDVTVWLDARSVPVADGGRVPEWPNYSGRGGHPLQATTNKQPIVRRDAAGEIRHVRGDGLNDVLIAADAVVIGSQPYTLFLVIRQNAGGQSEEAWFSQGAGGAPLIYKDATTNDDELHVWAGGAGDLVYRRGSAWPMPFKVMAFVFNGADSKIYENGVLKVTGDSSHPGTNGITGLTLFNRFAEDLPAKCDIASVILAAIEADQAKVGEVTDYLVDDLNLS